MKREAKVERKTKETKVEVSINLDGRGYFKIDTSYPFLNHMLELFSWHGFFDLEILARGDTQIDYHHLVEDVGISLGKAFGKALKEKQGIKRYGNSFVPMDDVLAQCVVDISGRPLFILHSSKELKGEIFETFNGFFRGFSYHSGITVHINLCWGQGYHHILEAIFKAFALSLDEACMVEDRRKTVPSIKGNIDEV